MRLTRRTLFWGGLGLAAIAGLAVVTAIVVLIRGYGEIGERRAKTTAEDTVRLRALRADPMAGARPDGARAVIEGSEDPPGRPADDPQGGTVSSQFADTGPPEQAVRFYLSAAQRAGWQSLEVRCQPGAEPPSARYIVTGRKDFGGWTGTLQLFVRPSSVSVQLTSPFHRDAGGRAPDGQPPAAQCLDRGG